MFTLNHYIWLAVSVTTIIVFTVYLNKYKPSLKNVLTLCCVGGVLSELVKTFSVLKMVPSADGSSVYPYIEPEHLPFHLCSIQILFIFYARFAKDGGKKDALLAFMYPTCSMGACLALLLPSIFPNPLSVDQAFTHPLAYQYFLYHAMLIILGLYIFTSRQVDIRPKHYLTSIGILGVLAFCSLYVNSMFGTAVYENSTLISVENTTNFFFTYAAPINIKFTEPWHWYLYLGIIFLLALLLFAVFYIPVFVKHKSKKKESV